MAGDIPRAYDSPIAAVRSRSRFRSTSGAIMACRRCGRTKHSASDCWFFTHVSGRTLTDDHFYNRRRTRRFAREHRRKPTPSEARLFEALRREGLRPRFQYPVGTDQGDRIVDIFFEDERFAVEVDGGYHKRTQRADAARQRAISAHGIVFLRCTNEEVDAAPAKVVDRIKRRLRARRQ